MQGPSGRSNKGGEEVQEGSVAPAGRKTLETLGAADSIAEALEMAASEKKRHEVSLFIPHWKYLFVNVSACNFLLCLHLSGFSNLPGHAANLPSIFLFAQWLLHIQHRYARPEACS